jgi:hypothetical protein
MLIKADYEPKGLEIERSAQIRLKALHTQGVKLIYKSNAIRSNK